MRLPPSAGEIVGTSWRLTVKIGAWARRLVWDIVPLRSGRCSLRIRLVNWSWGCDRLRPALGDSMNHRRCGSVSLNQGRARHGEYCVVAGNGCGGRIQGLVFLGQLGDAGCWDAYTCHAGAACVNATARLLNIRRERPRGIQVLGHIGHQLRSSSTGGGNLHSPAALEGFKSMPKFWLSLSVFAVISTPVTVSCPSIF